MTTIANGCKEQMYFMTVQIVENVNTLLNNINSSNKGNNTSTT